MKILTAQQIRAAERDAVLNGIFSYKDMMYAAAKATFDCIKENFADRNSDICIVCGNGNNGGDGLVLAGILKENGYNVKAVLPLGKPESSPACEFLYILEDLEICDTVPAKCDLLIDALFGIGLNRPIEGSAAEIIEAMNSCVANKLAIDIPSGVSANAEFSGIAFYADITLTFIALKICFILPISSEYCGEVKVLQLGVPVNEFTYETTKMPLLSKRPKNSHKGTYGTVLTVTGSYGMCGAAVLCAKATLSGGVGIVKSFVCDKNYIPFTLAVPEAVTIPVGTSNTGVPVISRNLFADEMQNANALVIGCGLGKSEDAKTLVKILLGITSIPTILDADGINTIAGSIDLLRRSKAPMIVTPHSKEMARLCKTTVEAVESDRIGISKRVAAESGAVVVLKGANTIIASPDGRVLINMTGNPGMATGGSGDVLSGIIAARLCLGDNAFDAAANAVYLHGLSGDRLKSRFNLEGITPSDLIEELKTIK